jgi:hypothetical protein
VGEAAAVTNPEEHPVNIRTRKITSLILAGSILAGGATGLAVSSATANDNGSPSMSVQQARGGQNAPAAV